MASYRGHLMFASTLGVGYGALGMLQWQLDSGAVILGAALTTVGGLLPDLDSDSGVPVRELFSAAATVVPLILFPRLQGQGFSPEQNLAIMVGVYVVIRYVLSSLFKRFTVHRGMFHSIPALFIAGLATYLLFQSPVQAIRFFLAGGVASGTRRNLCGRFHGAWHQVQSVCRQRPEVHVQIGNGNGDLLSAPGRAGVSGDGGEGSYATTHPRRGEDRFRAVRELGSRPGSRSSVWHAARSKVTG